jgi:hypothetical protein
MEMLVCIILKKAHNRKDRAAVVSADLWKFTKCHKCCAGICNADEKFLLLYHVGCFPKLEMCSCIWFKEGNGLCNCVVLFKHMRN